MAKMATSAVTIAHQQLELPADAVECFHGQWYNGDVRAYMRDRFVVGTYKLVDQETQTKTGRLYSFRLAAATNSMYEVQRIDTEAIFDLKWSPRPLTANGVPILCVVDTAGGITLYQQSINDGDDDGGGGGLRALHSLTPSPPLDDTDAHDDDGKTPPPSSSSSSQSSSAAALSVCWSHTPPSTTCVVSYADGWLRMVDVNDNHTMRVSSAWRAHELEAWNAIVDRRHSHLVYSGADDALFKGWDTRQPPEWPTFVNKRHDAGVCCVIDSPYDEYEHTLVTGSYDEHIRWWDKRKVHQPLHSLSLGGGVWKLKWYDDADDHQHQPCRQRIVAACMRNGFHVLDGYEEIVMYDKHTDLAYGCDWLPSSSSSSLVTCSFYDHQLHAWRIEEEK